jgi:hypothetical protein
MDSLHVCLTEDDLREFFAGHNVVGDYMAFDIETKGNQVFDPESVVVGFGLADARGAGYWTAEHWPTLLELLRKHSPRLVAHNVFFDGAYVMRDGNELWPSFEYCTYGLYKQLATEGWPGQRWGLKDVQKQLLGWEETNERDLLEWLVQQGHQTATRKSIDDVVQKEDWFLTTEGAYAKADKGEMWRAPAEVLGKYCALDAHATHLFLTKVLLPAVQRFKVLDDFHREVFLPNVRILIEQELSGMMCNVPGLKKHAENLRRQVDETAQAFYKHPEVARHIEAYNKSIVEKHLAREPAKYSVQRDVKEPPKFKKDGSITKRWRQWSERAPVVPEPTKRWMQWEVKRQELASTNHFNLASGPQLAWLFYQQLEKPVLLTTESGSPAVDGKAMGQWGEPGVILKTRSKAEKELGYVEAAIGYQRNGIIHPQFRVPGTLTGRLSGSGGLNCYPDTTEVLTQSGWIALRNLPANTSVWQTDINGKGSWTIPTAFVTGTCDVFIQFGSARRASLTVTANHRMVWADYKGNNRRVSIAQDLFAEAKRYIPVTSERLEDSSADFVDYEELARALALQADGHLRPDRTDVYTIGVKKQRKVEKLRELFGPESGCYNGVYTWNYIKFKSKYLSGCSLKLLRLGNLPAGKVASFVFKELRCWDGHERHTRRDSFEYYTAVQKNADELQSYFARSGYCASLHKYATNKYVLYVSTLQVREVKKSRDVRIVPGGKFACITVPSEFLIVRQNGYTFLSGNCQQQPKTREYLSQLHARPGTVWVDFDHTALEPCVLTELSRDPNMLKLYGPTAKSNDVYIFVGSAVPGIRETFAACGYNPDAPTKESISRIKKEHKVLRNICKVLTLSAQYGAGPRKIHETLKLQGIRKELEEIQEIHRAYWQLFAGIKEYEKFLLGCWQRNGGWVLNGVGRPLGVHRDMTKDLVNRCLSGDTIVLSKQRGFIKLCDVLKADTIWDGIDFVCHDGLINQGVRLTMELNGVIMTPDHDVLINSAWKEAQHVRVEDIESAATPGVSWKAIWRLGYNILGEISKGIKERARSYLRGCKVRS